MSDDTRERVAAQRRRWRGAAMSVTDRDPPGYKESGQAIRFYEFELSAAEVALGQLRSELAKAETERDALAKRLGEAESVRETFLQVLVALASSKTIQEAATNLEALLETIVP